MGDLDKQNKDRQEALIKQKHTHLLQIAEECDLKMPARENEKNGGDSGRIS